jgi:uncharacterized protein (DUF1330 family)
MPAYVIASVTEAHDDEALAEYRRRNSAAVDAHGGRFVVRGGPVEVLEGDWSPLRIVVIEFDDAAAARAWYESDDYQEAVPIRQGASTTGLIVVEGVEPPARG